MNSTGCGDRNECLNDNGGCAHRCVNTASGFNCECFSPDDSAESKGWPYPVYTLSNNTYDCLDVNECERGTVCTDAGKECINRPGYYSCITKPGSLAKSGIIHSAATGKYWNILPTRTCITSVQHGQAFNE